MNLCQTAPRPPPIIKICEWDPMDFQITLHSSKQLPEDKASAVLCEKIQQMYCTA